MAKRDEKLEKRKKWNRDDQVSTFIFFDFILEIVLFLPRIIIHFIKVGLIIIEEGTYNLDNNNPHVRFVIA